jgi:hypothetical protein
MLMRSKIQLSESTVPEGLKVLDHLKAFPIKLRVLHEQVGNRGFDLEVDDRFPPGTSGLFVFGDD